MHDFPHIGEDDILLDINAGHEKMRLCTVGELRNSLQMNSLLCREESRREA